MLALKILWLFLITFYLGRAIETGNGNQTDLQVPKSVPMFNLNKTNASSLNYESTPTSNVYANAPTKLQKEADSISEKFDTDEQASQEGLNLETSYLYNSDANASDAFLKQFENFTSSHSLLNEDNQSTELENYTYIQDVPATTYFQNASTENSVTYAQNSLQTKQYEFNETSELDPLDLMDAHLQLIDTNEDKSSDESYSDADSPLSGEDDSRTTFTRLNLTDGLVLDEKNEENVTQINETNDLNANVGSNTEDSSWLHVNDASDDNETVEEIFKDVNYDLDFSDSKVSHLGDIIAVWLNEATNVTAIVPTVRSNITSAQANGSIESQISTSIENSTEKQMRKQNSSELFENLEFGYLTDKNVNIITQSRVATNTLNDHSGAQAIDDNYFYATILNQDGDLCVSLNLSMVVSINNSKLYLTSCNEVETYCQDDEAHIIFNWNDVTKSENTSVQFLIVEKNNHCFIDTISTEILKNVDSSHNFKELLTNEKTNLHLFSTKLGSTYESNASISINMNQGIQINLNWVQFSVDQNWNFQNALSSHMLVTYYKEIIGGSIGFLLFSLMILIIFKKIKNETAGFKPSIV